MPRAAASTARRWAFAAWPAVVAFSVVTIARTSDEVGAAFLVLGLLTVQLPWGWRFWRWFRAARARPQTFDAAVRQSYSVRSLTVGSWLVLTGDDQPWYQRVMWEPWLGQLGRGRRRVTARRVGRRGPFVIDVVGYGRLWPVGRARRTEPWLETLTSPDAGLRARWPAALALVVFTGLVSVLPWGWLVGCGCVAYGLSLWLFFGGPPLARRLAPR